MARWSVRPRQWPWYGGAAAIVGIAGWWFVTTVQPALRTPPDILLISIDTLRADRLGSYGHRSAHTPVLDALAARGARFTRATTVTPLTLPAHTSLMTARFPTRHGVRDNGGYYVPGELETLAERARAAGYRTGAFVSSFVLDRRWGLDQGFDEYWDDFDLSGGGSASMDDIQRPATPVIDRALRWMTEPGEAPTLTWVHLYDPHTPYAAPEPHRSRFPATMAGAYDAEIAYVDVEIGRLLEDLRARGRLDRTLVVVTGDHGESLGEHGEQTHGFFIYQSTMHIPLIVAGPDVTAAVIDRPARIVDIAPTLLSLADLPGLDDADGRALLPAPPDEDAPVYLESFYPRFHYGWSELTSVSDGRFKYIAAPRPELYDLEQDPGEVHNLVVEQDRRAASLAAMVKVLRDREVASAPQPMDADVQARLQSLGYVAAGVQDRTLPEGRARADPKDKIGLYVELKAALLDREERRWSDAAARLTRVLAEDPEMIEAHSVLGGVWLDAGRPAEAVAALRSALAIDPEHRGAVFNLALAYLHLGQTSDAEVGFARARELDPRDGKPRWQLADLWMQRGEYERARSLLVESLALKVDRPAFLLKLAECLIELDRPREAVAHLDEVIRLRPRMPRAHYDLGLALEALGDTTAARAAYVAERERHPDAWAAAYNLGRLLLSAGEIEEAAREFGVVVDRNPEFSGGHLHLARVHLDQGDLSGALAEAREGLRRQPPARLEAFGRYLLADIYAQQGRADAAAREAARAARLEAKPQP
jgi:arylsulfatase A-like enzyme/tetratricopeptide (TPR) repeat protein